MDILSLNDYVLIAGFVLFVGVGVVIEIRSSLIVPFIKKYF